MDTFRFNLDYENGPVIAKAEYRFYDGYNFSHTGWLGYNFEDESQLQVGLNRVPFGLGPYGVSQSWSFDQHYYVGLADDMDLGAKYTFHPGDWTIDLAFSNSNDFVGGDEFTTFGANPDNHWQSRFNINFGYYF